MRSLASLLASHPVSVVTALILGLLASFAEGFGMSLLIPFLSYLSDGQAHQNGMFLTWIYRRTDQIPESMRVPTVTACILAALTAKAGLSYAYTVQSHRIQACALHKLRADTFSHVAQVSLGYLQSKPTGELVSLLINDTTNIARGVAHRLWMFTQACTIIVLVALLVLISLPMTLFVGVTLALVSFFVHWLSRSVDRLGRQSVESENRLYTLALESLRRGRLSRALERRAWDEAGWNRASEVECASTLAMRKVLAAIEPISEGLAGCVILAVLLVALPDQSSLPMLIVFAAMFYRLQPQIQRFDANRVALRALSASSTRVESLFAVTDTDATTAGRVPFEALREAIRFREVSFSYPASSELALRDVTFTVPKGKTTVLVGPSGAGKSTVLNLIMRFYDVNSGDIWIDDVRLSDLELSSWRKSIALVSQETDLFSDTIEANVRYGRLEATPDEIRNAIELSGAREFISQLPDGLASVVGESGTLLSGGQRQRLMLARAILRKAKIIILDEATNALDTPSEQLIQNAISTLSKDRTIIVVAHRPTALVHADHVVLMDRGEIVGEGAIADVLTRDGLLSRLYGAPPMLDQ